MRGILCLFQGDKFVVNGDNEEDKENDYQKDNVYCEEADDGKDVEDKTTKTTRIMILTESLSVLKTQWNVKIILFTDIFTNDKIKQLYARYSFPNKCVNTF